MIDDMTIRQFAARTPSAPTSDRSAAFTAFLGDHRIRPAEDVRRYQLHMAALGASPAKMNLASTVLRFFFHVTLGRPGSSATAWPEPRKLPVVLSVEEVAPPARRSARA